METENERHQSRDQYDPAYYCVIHLESFTYWEVLNQIAIIGTDYHFLRPIPTTFSKTYKHPVEIVTGAELIRVDSIDAGVALEIRVSGEGRSLTATRSLVATGRHGNSVELGLEAMENSPAIKYWIPVSELKGAFHPYLNLGEAINLSCALIKDRA